MAGGAPDVLRTGSAVPARPRVRDVASTLIIGGGPGGAAVLIAASKAGRFGVFHDALYQAGRPSTETIALAGNAAAITPDLARSPEIEAEIQKNMRLAGQLGATGTPLFVIGDKVINAAVGFDKLRAAIAAARAKG